MKKIMFTLVAATFSLLCSAQVNEVKSGVVQMNISRKGAETKKVEQEARALADKTPPLITIQIPDLFVDPVPKSASKLLTVKGKVEDAGGIFEVVVNGVEAKVSADGIFLAEINQGYGTNNIRIIATDVAQNKATFEFQSERLTDDLATQMNLPVEKPANTFVINFTAPHNDELLVTATENYNLRACITSSVRIRQLMIYKNDSFVNGYNAAQIVKQGDCDFAINENVPLSLGVNDLKVVFYADNDTITKNVQVEYSFHAARNFALIIANESYNDAAIPDLSQPVKDATELYNTLTRLYNFDQNNVIFLKNPTKSEIIGTLHSYRSLIGPDDNLLIFYAGHGFWDAGMQVGYWLPRDANKDNPVNWLPNTDLTNYLGAIKTKHTLLVADACFSGGIFKSSRSISDSFAVEKLYQLNSRKAITSGMLTEVPDRSAFFQYFIKNLKENTGEYLPSEQLFSQLKTAVINNSENVPQFGTIQNVGDEGGDFIFIKKK
jgi:hypothetical protein